MHAPALQLGSNPVTASDYVHVGLRVLGVTISSDLSLDKHVCLQDVCS